MSCCAAGTNGCLDLRCRSFPLVGQVAHVQPTPWVTLQEAILADIQPAELLCRGATLSLGRRAMEPGHLLHSALTCPSCAAARRLKPRHLHPPVNNSSVFLTTTTYVRRSGRIINGTQSGRTTPQDSALQFQTPVHTPGMTLPRRAWVRLNRLRTGVGRFRSCLYKWGMASSAACECGAEQTVDHVVLHCPVHRHPHGLMIMYDETTEWLLNTCPDI